MMQKCSGSSWGWGLRPAQASFNQRQSRVSGEAPVAAPRQAVCCHREVLGALPRIKRTVPALSAQPAAPPPQQGSPLETPPHGRLPWGQRFLPDQASWCGVALRPRAPVGQERGWAGTGGLQRGPLNSVLGSSAQHSLIYTRPRRKRHAPARDRPGTGLGLEQERPRSSDPAALNLGCMLAPLGDFKSHRVQTTYSRMSGVTALASVIT